MSAVRRAQVSGAQTGRQGWPHWKAQRLRLLTGLAEVTRVDREGQHVVVTGTGELVNAVILALHGAGVTARDVKLDSSNLEDAFVKLTGRNLHPEGAAA